MKKLWFPVVMWIVSVSSACFAQAGQTQPTVPAEKKVSQTFAEILTRVTERDPECGAILRVKPKADSPSLHWDLLFSITEKHGGAQIVLSANDWGHTLVDRGIYEIYVLSLDQSIREELNKQKRLQELIIEREAKAKKEAAEAIEKLTKGKLKVGMTQDEVIAIVGRPNIAITNHQKGHFFSEYNDYILCWYWTGLVNALDTKEFFIPSARAVFPVRRTEYANLLPAPTNTLPFGVKE